MVLVNVPTAPPAVNRPPLVMLPPPAATLHDGVTGTTLPALSRPVTVICWLWLMARLTGLGDSVIDATPPTVTVTVAYAVTEPLVARTVFVNVPRLMPAVKR